MKSLLVGTMLFLFNLGCGGYGSGMGMTPATAPAISPGSGTYSTPLTDTISDGTPNAVIYVTEDGSTPSLSSPIYHRPFMVTQSAKGEAIAAAGGYSSKPRCSRQLYPAVGSSGACRVLRSAGLAAE